jgi:hypothetical protein
LNQEPSDEEAYDIFGDAASGALKVVLTREEE